MLKYFMYCRKSTEEDDRQVLSNKSQKDELEPLATRNHFVIHDYIEEAASAKAAGTRPLFMDMVRRIKNGEANAILCWHPNRLSRNATDAATLVDLMDAGRLLEIRTPSQTFTNTPGDKFLLTLFCSQAKLENDNKGIDVERGLRAKAEMGWYPGVAPTGYLNDKSKNRGERDLLNDPERFPLVKRMWQMMLTGTYTPSQILKIVNTEWGFRTRRTKKQGGKPLSLSSLYYIFHNPFYYGWYEYPKKNGKWYQGKHEPMVTKQEFDHVQALLARNGNPRASKHLTFSFTGLIRCGSCPGMITAEEKHQLICTKCRFKFVYKSREHCPKCKTAIAEMSSPQFLHYTYYHCARRKADCKEKSVEIRDLENQITEQLGNIQISNAFKAWAFNYLQELYSHDKENKRHIAASRNKAYENCVRRLESLVRLKTSPENIDGSLLSDEEYNKERQKLLREKNEFIQSVDNTKPSPEEALRQSEQIFDFAHSAQRKFIAGDFQVKKQIFARLGSNLILRDKKLIIEAKKPFVLIHEFTSADAANNNGIEPENPGANIERNKRNKPRSFKQLRDLKEVRTQQIYQTLVQCIYFHFRNNSIAYNNHEN